MPISAQTWDNSMNGLLRGRDPQRDAGLRRSQINWIGRRVNVVIVSHLHHEAQARDLSGVHLCTSSSPGQKGTVGGRGGRTVQSQGRSYREYMCSVTKSGTSSLFSCCCSLVSRKCSLIVAIFTQQSSDAVWSLFCTVDAL